MTINKDMKENILTVEVEGRLDTTTAPELEESLRESMDDAKELILNIENLEYMSSAGLRVLLSAQKQMSKQGSMKVINVNDTIKEIFEVTGFNDILTIE